VEEEIPHHSCLISPVTGEIKDGGGAVIPNTSPRRIPGACPQWGAGIQVQAQIFLNEIGETVASDRNHHPCGQKSFGCKGRGELATFRNSFGPVVCDGVGQKFNPSPRMDWKCLGG
jgi:hypothetical protein